MDKSYWTKFYAKHKVGDKPSLFAQFVWDSYLHQMQVDKKSSANAKAHNTQMHANTHINANTNFSTHNTHNAQNTQTSSHTPYTGTLSLLELGCGSGRDALFFAKNKIQITVIDQVADEISYLAKHCATTTKGIVNTHFLAPSGIVAIEARGKKNSLYRQGEPVEGEANAFIHDSHYRRFVDFESLCEVLESQLNLTIHFAKEERGFAPFNGEDDYFFRVVGIARNERERESKRARPSLIRLCHSHQARF